MSCFVVENISICPLDVIFAIDGSGSIGERNFANFKQIAMDIVWSLPVDQYEVHIGFIQYTAAAIAVLSLTDSYNQSEIASHIWASEYTAGSTFTANALAAVGDMFNASGATNNSRAVVFFTDGPDTNYALDAYRISEELKDNAHMYAVREYLFITKLIIILNVRNVAP